MTNSTSTIGSFFKGFFLPIKGLSLLMENATLKKVAAVPFLINLILFAIVFFTLFLKLWNWDPVDISLQLWDAVDPYINSSINFVLDYGKWLLLPIFFIITYFIFSFVGMIVASPFNDTLSEKLEHAIQYVEKNNTNDVRMMHSTYRSLVSTTKMMGRQLGWTLMSLPLLLVPLVGFIPLFMVTAYFTSCGYLDVALARHHMTPKVKDQIFKENKAALLGFGMAMELLFLVPFLNLALIPVGVCAGTWLYCRHLND